MSSETKKAIALTLVLAGVVGLGTVIDSAREDQAQKSVNNEALSEKKLKESGYTVVRFCNSPTKHCL